MFALLDLGAIAGYFAVAPTREPHFEIWGKLRAGDWCQRTVHAGIMMSQAGWPTASPGSRSGP